ncbi:MAG: DUF4956 domain-containing protein [Caldilineaceae bacterium]|nr:DUF4956 domain-containing protein [Caldilineaceae bacterium]
MSPIDLLIGCILNLLVAVLIVRFIYYPVKQDKNYVFTFLAFNTVVYFVVSFLTGVELSVGFGFGLFAIFSVLRYRTATMSTREMTYLFVVIAIPVMNSLLMREGAWLLLVEANLIIVTVLYVLEQGWGFRYAASNSIRYERIELIRPENHALLMADLRQRTGLPINRIEIGRINFLEDTAELNVYYDQPDAGQWPQDHEMVFGDIHHLSMERK